MYGYRPRLSNASIRILAQSFVVRGTASFPPPTRVDAERGHGLHPSSLPGQHQQTGRKWHDAQAHCRGVPRHGANKNNRPGKSRDLDPARHCLGWLGVCDASLWLMYYPVLYLHITSPSRKHGAHQLHSVPSAFNNHPQRPHRLLSYTSRVDNWVHSMPQRQSNGQAGWR